MIDTSSVYNLELELSKLPEEQDKIGKLRAKAIKRVEKLQMKLDILVAEKVDEICKKEKINAASGRAEVRRTRVLLDPLYQEMRNLLIIATGDMNMVNSAYFAFNNKCTILLELYKNARRQMYDAGRVEMEKDGTRLSTKMKQANDRVDYD